MWLLYLALIVTVKGAAPNLIFIRHGESTHNRDGGRNFGYWTTHPDAMLTTAGYRDGLAAKQAIEDSKEFKDVNKRVLVLVSNLRRAALTGIISMGTIPSTFVTVEHLQEVSAGGDAASLSTPARRVGAPNAKAAEVMDTDDWKTEVVNADPAFTEDEIKVLAQASTRFGSNDPDTGVDRGSYVKNYNSFERLRGDYLKKFPSDVRRILKAHPDALQSTFVVAGHSHWFTHAMHLWMASCTEESNFYQTCHHLADSDNKIGNGSPVKITSFGPTGPACDSKCICLDSRDDANHKFCLAGSSKSVPMTDPTKAEANPANKAEANPANKAEANPANKAEANPANKAEANPANKARFRQQERPIKKAILQATRN